MGFVKHNAGAMVFIDTAKEEIYKLMKEDMVIFGEAQMILLEMPVVMD
jgi:hypothetical protein